MNTEAILQLCVDRATNLYLLHVMGIRLEAVQGANRQKLVETNDSKIFARVCANVHHQGDEGFVLMDDFFRLCECPTFNLYEDLVGLNQLASEKEKKEFIESKNLLARRKKQMKFLQKLHSTTRAYFNAYFNKFVGGLIKQDITQIQGVPSDEYFVGKILELVSTGRNNDEILNQSYATEFIQDLPDLSGPLKGGLLKKLRFKGKATIYAKTWKFYNNRRMRGTQFVGIKGLRMKVLKDAKYFNNQIKVYAHDELTRYVDRNFIGENMEREITDASENQEIFRSIVKETDSTFNLIESSKESERSYKRSKREKLKIAKKDINRSTSIEERKEILEAREDFIGSVVNAIQFKDVAKSDLKFISRTLLRETTSSLGGITEKDKNQLKQIINMLQDEEQILEVVGEKEYLDQIQEILERVLIQYPDSISLITEFISALSKVTKATQKAMKSISENIEVINKAIDQSSEQFQPSEFESVRRLLYSRRMNQGDLDVPEILELSDSDRKSYLGALANDSSSDYRKREKDVETYVLARLGNVDKLDEWRNLHNSSDTSSKEKADKIFEEFKEKLEIEFSTRARGRQPKPRQEVQENSAKDLLAPKDEWVSSRSKDKDNNFPYQTASVPPLKALKDAISSVRSDLSTREIGNKAKEILKSQEKVLLIDGKITESSTKTAIKNVLETMLSIEDRGVWFKDRDALLRKVKMDAVKELSTQRSLEDLIDENSEKALIEAGVATESNFSNMEFRTVKRNIEQMGGEDSKREALLKAHGEAFRNRAVSYSASDLDRELHDYDQKNNYGSKKEAWSKAVSNKEEDALKILKAMGVTLSSDELDLLILDSEVPSRSDTNLAEAQYAKAKKKLISVYVDLKRLDGSEGVDTLAEDYREERRDRKYFLEGLKDKYRNSPAMESIRQELSEAEEKTKADTSKEIEKALGALLKGGGEFNAKRKRRIMQSGALRSKIYSDINEKITEADRKLGAKNVKDILRSSKILDLSLEQQEELLDLSECFPSAPALADKDKTIAKMYLKATDSGLPVFADLSASVYQSSDLKFPNDFFSASVGMALMKNFRLGLRAKYSPRMADHIGFFGVDATGKMVAPDNSFTTTELEPLLNVNKSVDSGIGSIPETFFAGEYASILELIKYSDDRATVKVKGDVMTFTDEEGDKHTHSISKIQSELKDVMIGQMASDFGISSQHAEAILDTFLNKSLKTDGGVSYGRATRVYEWFRSAVVDLGYISSVWALEMATGNLEDVGLNEDCLDFMDRVATDGDKKKTAKKVKKALR